MSGLSLVLSCAEVLDNLQHFLNYPAKVVLSCTSKDIREYIYRISSELTFGHKAPILRLTIVDNYVYQAQTLCLMHVQLGTVIPRQNAKLNRSYSTFNLINFHRLQVLTLTDAVLHSDWVDSMTQLQSLSLIHCKSTKSITQVSRLQNLLALKIVHRECVDLNAGAMKLTRLSYACGQVDVSLPVTLRRLKLVVGFNGRYNCSLEVTKLTNLDSLIIRAEGLNSGDVRLPAAANLTRLIAISVSLEFPAPNVFSLREYERNSLIPADKICPLHTNLTSLTPMIWNDVHYQEVLRNCKRLRSIKVNRSARVPDSVTELVVLDDKIPQAHGVTKLKLHDFSCLRLTSQLHDQSCLIENLTDLTINNVSVCDVSTFPLLPNLNSLALSSRSGGFLSSTNLPSLRKLDIKGITIDLKCWSKLTSLSTNEFLDQPQVNHIAQLTNLINLEFRGKCATVNFDSWTQLVNLEAVRFCQVSAANLIEFRLPEYVRLITGIKIKST